TAITALALLAALVSGAAAAWLVLLAAVAAETGYLALLHHHRRVLAEREFAALLHQPEGESFAWADLDHLPADPDLEKAIEMPSPAGSQTWALLRFLLANLAGWALSPVVFVAPLLLGKPPQDPAGQRWLATLQSAQERLRERSFRTLAISAATT